LKVGVASENNNYDAIVYAHILRKLIGVPVEPYIPQGMSFNGCNAVAKLAPTFLSRCLQAGVRNAILAVDNDGGSQRRLEHADDHALPATYDESTECRVCWLHGSITTSWVVGNGRCSLVVPVQTLETWLLVARGQPPEPPVGRPEGYFGRAALKRRLFGKGTLPPMADRCAVAIDALESPYALDRLRERHSFMRFEAGVRDWIA